jgi:hypothetical protein
MPRSRPLTIAPLIPLLGLAGILGIDRLHHTRFLPAFVIAWGLLFAALSVYVFNKMIEARRARAGR